MLSKRPVLLVLVTILGVSLLLASLLLARGSARADGPVVSPEVAAEITRSILARLGSSSMYSAQTILFTTRVEDIALSENQEWATAWMVPVDRTTGEDLVVEPGLAILRLQDGAWQPALPLDAAWRDWLAAMPEELMSTEDRAFWLDMSAASASPVPAAARSGYLLPWAKGMAVSMTRSLAHDADFPSGSSHFSFDFANGTMFELLAAKDGVVWMTKDSEPNGCDQNAGCSGNYIILKETDATGDYFQLYLHLAQNSIPDGLVKGVAVKQGDPIGIVDDTGYSTGHHLHFMVHRTSTSYYGTAIDITFDDVDINGGRPRAKIDLPYCKPGDVCTDYRTLYVSGNEPCFECIPPVGGFVLPDEGGVVTGTLQLSAWGADPQTGLRYGQFLAAFNGKWREVGPQFTTENFSYTWDLCASGVPDGPIPLGLRLRDNDHNTAELLGLRIVTKSYICPAAPPACTPGDNQVALFDSPGYTGNCSLFGIGAYPSGTSLGLVGADNVESILLGANVQATLFASDNFAGRAETFFEDDSSLADNLIKANWARSLLVQQDSAQPFVPEPSWPPEAAAFTPQDPILLYWLNTGAVTEFELRLTLPITDVEPIATRVITIPWQTEPYWSLETLTQTRYTGEYTWQVRGRSPAGMSGWSGLSSFSVVPQPLASIYIPLVQGSVTYAASPALPLSAPPAAPQATLLFDDMESLALKWQTTGLWRHQQAPIPASAKSGQFFMWAGAPSATAYAYDGAKASALTSQTIAVPASGTYYLTFFSYYETETKNPDWDQRRVQISANGGPFVNVMQMYTDPFRYWVQSPPISLAAYRGQQIRVRFVFDTVDAAPLGDRSNAFRGWLIDDVSITDATPACTPEASEPNDTPASAAPLAVPSAQVSGVICPGRDYDYYVFTGQAGDRLLADIDARTLTPASKLDPVLELLDSDGRSLVRLSDDEVSQTLLDSYMQFTLPRSGTYYLRVSSWYPGQGGNDYNYTLKFALDAETPQLSWISPAGGLQLKAGDTLTVSARITETVSGISRVDFFWHDPNWAVPTWSVIPGGSQVGGVWQAVFDPQVLSGSQPSIDLYIQVTDKAGNAAGAGVRGLVADVVPPAVSLSTLAPTQASSSFVLSWNGTDDQSGIAYFELQRELNGGGFTTLLTDTLPGKLFQVLPPDSLLDYRLLALDRFGNASPPITRTTFVPSAAVLCSAPDSFEPDSAALQAGPAGLNQLRNFCDPTLAGVFAPDADWVALNVIQDRKYQLLAAPTPGSPAWPVITLLAADGTTEILTLTDGGPGEPVTYYWTADRNGLVYVRVTSYDPAVLGSGASYELSIESTNVLFMPMAWK